MGTLLPQAAILTQPWRGGASGWSGLSSPCSRGTDSQGLGARSLYCLSLASLSRALTLGSLAWWCREGV